MNFKRLTLVVGGCGVLLMACCAGLVPDSAFAQAGGTYSLIEKGLYQGGDSKKPPPGTKAVLNLCENKDPYQCEIHVWEAIKDGKPPTLAWLREKVEFVDAHRKKDLTVYVHCRNGASRSALVVIAYVMFKNQWGRDKALEFVRSKRMETRPSPVFRDVLLEWERELKKKKT